MVADYRRFGLVFICVCAKVYEIGVFKVSINGDRVVETREGQFIENDGVRI